MSMGTMLPATRLRQRCGSRYSAAELDSSSIAKRGGGGGRECLPLLPHTTYCHAQKFNQ
jgi:hypothetical protein